MGKITGFLEIDRNERKYAPVAERVQHYREFVIPLSEKEKVELLCQRYGINVFADNVMMDTGGDVGTSGT